MQFEQNDIQTTLSLLEQYGKGNALKGTKLRFEGTGGKDVYNITAPFIDRGEQIIAGRLEGRETEYSEVVFFRQEQDVWVPHPDYPSYELQDPFFTLINGELIFGGVRVIPDPLYPEHIVSWVTQFYRGKDIASLRAFLKGPYHMKDLRLIELADGEIGVLTRPQGLKGGRGSIGFYKARSLADITREDIEAAPLFENQFALEEWGGANEPHLLADGRIGVLGHIASFDGSGQRHYYAVTFAFDPDTLERTPLKIIARRSDFPEGDSKRADLVDVIFSGGLVRKTGGLAELYVGASDAEAYRIEISDPFLEYEQR
ncbi:hypothetical protein BSK59_32715 [Paenibacillus odorifer]|uniref:DUF1861 family protein n=1 Tax=Paenibacillus odorifer TaxID=189426 RepID=UPI00096DFA93|nr:DUF1861 family protein [Paenibacillus odorifer]OME45363.1 hypothetical protein BSK59_32715 [Paenibacillus odorifer]